MPESPVKYLRSPNFTLDCGKILPDVVVAYQTYGSQQDDQRRSLPVVLVSTCFGEKLEEHNPLIGEGKALDPEQYYLIRVGLLGGSNSSSPSNTPKPFAGEDFPPVTYSDNIRGHVLLLRSLGIDMTKSPLHAAVGFSMGGQIAYHWGALYPQYIKHIVCIATSARTSQHNIAFLEGPKAALRAAGKDQFGKGCIGPKAFGHAYCAWAYSHDWFEQRLWEESLGCPSTMIEFMDEQWSNQSWDGWDLLALASTWQYGDITIATRDAGAKPFYHSYEDALNNINCPALIMPTRTDQYFPPEDSEREIKHIPRGKLRIVETIYGHVGGGYRGGGSATDNEFIDHEVRSFLSKN